MSLNEILHTPYQLLMMMQADKVRVVYESDSKSKNNKVEMNALDLENKFNK